MKSWLLKNIGKWFEEDGLSLLEGAQFKVKGLDGCDGEQRRKLYAMGLIPGTLVTLVRILKGSDTIIIQCESAQFAIAKTLWSKMRMLHIREHGV